MNTPGDLLRSARESKGLSLSETAAMTRISCTMLKHLEQNRFEEFNAEVFIRGHLRNYAREVGADPEKVIQAYERLSGSRRAARSVKTEPKRSPRSAGTKKKAPTPKRSKKSRRGRTTSSDRFETWRKSIGPTHMVAVGLVILGIILFASLLSGNRATAQDPAQFPVKSQDAWELERDVEQTRWLLEQPESDGSDDQ